jgi:hypothetical protein
VKATILRIASAPYGQYDTEVLADVEGTLVESVLRRQDLPADLDVGQEREVKMYKHLIESIGEIV